MGVAEQYKNLRDEIDQVCIACGRAPQDVVLVAVSKTVGIAEVNLALEAGAKDFGENRSDELVKKHQACPSAQWHFIGNIQSRRIADIVPCAHLIHSVYKAEHLPKIQEAAQRAGKVQNILLEVNSGEEQKDGIQPDMAFDFAEAASRLNNVRLCGLMTMAPQGDLNEARRCFKALRLLRDEMASAGVVDSSVFRELSMGMTEDWRQAVEEGATLIRVGRAVFSSEFA